MASHGYTEHQFNDFDDELYQQNLMLSHPTNILKLDETDTMYEYKNVDDCEDYNALNGDDRYEDSIELSRGGILDEETAARGLSNFGRSADGTMLAFLDCTVAGRQLLDIELLACYIHLQKVDVSYNNLTDISALSSISHMIYLDCSHNKLTSCLSFKSVPMNLRHADCSFNEITEMPDLSAYGCLEYLNLDNNLITEMRGIANCKRLQTLSLAHNKITAMRGMTGLPIRNLCLKYNLLVRIEDTETLTYLQNIDLAGNKIRSLLGLQKHDLLESIDLESNEVIDISEIKFVKDLHMLRTLNLLRNPINELPDYRLLILYRVPRLKELDRRKVDVKEKVAASNLFDPSMEVIAQRDHIMHVVYSFLQPKRIFESTLPSVETPYPMLVLVGPQGAGKKDLALKLCEEFSDYFGYGVCHTTRRRQPDEIHGKDYKFCSIDEFEELIKLGCFVETNMFNGQWYGLSMDSIESVAAQGLATVVNMELEGMLTLKKTHFSPRYVLILPVTKEAHEKRLKSRNMYSDGHIEDILKRASIYGVYNQEHPGSFDYMINSDDIAEAYKALRHLIMEYLSLTTSTAEGSERSGTPDRRSNNSGSQKSGSRPPTGTKLYTKMPNLHESSSKGALMEASILRRKEQAKDAVVGYIPSLYEQIVNKMPRTAPADLPTQIGLDTLRPRSNVIEPAESMSSSSNSGGSRDSSPSTNRSETRQEQNGNIILPDERAYVYDQDGSDVRSSSSLSGKFQVLPPISSAVNKVTQLTVN